MMQPKLGILAGSGALPHRLIEYCRDTGRDFFVIAFEGQTDPDMVSDVPHAWVRLGAAGTALDHLKKEGVGELVMAGGIRRPSLISLRPDAWAAKLLAKAGVKAFGDDGLLRAIIRALEEDEGFRVVAAHSLLPDNLAKETVYGSHKPDQQDSDDITRGIEVARGIGALDVGQAAVVHQGLVLAVEAIDGTDAMLSRVAGIRQEEKGGVLVKVRKPGQENRADLPTVGLDTVKKAFDAGLNGIAVEAGGALILDREAAIAEADTRGLFLLGVTVKGDSCG